MAIRNSTSRHAPFTVTLATTFMSGLSAAYAFEIQTGNTALSLAGVIPSNTAPPGA
jgi:hypothetical protein